jgi:uncharacterized protein YndB with AHSA1/START domain
MSVDTRAERQANQSAAAIAAQASPDREIVLERVFHAPRELVWKAWSDPEHIDKWWGPNGFRNETKSMDFKLGGFWRYLMHGPDGKVWVNWIRYDEIVPNERLAYAHGGEGDEPHFHVVITFTALGARTQVTMRSIFPSAEAVAEVKKFGAVAGGQQTMARFAGFLDHFRDGTADGAMVLTRLFDAPVHRVFEAWSTKQGLERWWGPKGLTSSCEVDFRVGGAYRMVMRDAQGGEYPFHGRYTEIIPDEKIAFSSTIEHLDNIEVTTTVTFVEENGKTRLTVRQSFPAHEEAARGQMEGWSGSLEKLDAVLQAAGAGS